MAIRIAIDAMGGDYAPQALIDGAVAVASRDSDLQIILVGLPDQLPAESRLPDNVTIEAAATMMAMDESVENLRKKKDSSIWIATKLVKEGRADAVVSAGSTAAQMAAALLLLGRIPGIMRPAVGLVFPNPHGGAMLLDAGANVEVTAEQYLQFGLMGSVCAETLLHRTNPRVALLVNGTEAQKGRDEHREAHRLLAASELNFVGNMEGRQIMSDFMDVIVTDGFTGNVVIKEAEGISKTLFDIIKSEIGKSFSRKLGGALLQSVFRDVKSLLDYKATGGAPLLGVNGVSIVCHGSSDAVAIENAIGVAIDCVKTGFIEKISSTLENWNAEAAEAADPAEPTAAEPQATAAAE